VQFRVRAHGKMARLEVDPQEMQLAWDKRDQIAAAIRKAGFTWVAQDLDGYRTGRSTRRSSHPTRADRATRTAPGQHRNR
jgi:PP-loop superfamily ATP-utilizing enzyme